VIEDLNEIIFLREQLVQANQTIRNLSEALLKVKPDFKEHPPLPKKALRFFDPTTKTYTKPGADEIAEYNEHAMMILGISPLEGTE